jgi:hypothetical protein
LRAVSAIVVENSSEKNPLPSNLFGLKICYPRAFPVISLANQDLAAYSMGKQMKGQNQWLGHLEDM